MNKILEFIVDFSAVIIIAFLSVMIYFGLRTEAIVAIAGQNIVEEFLSDTKKNGYFTVEDYENFIGKLSLTGILYDVKLEHKYNIVEPEYRMKTLEEILAAQRAVYEASNIYHYWDVVTEKPEVIIPDNSGLTMNTETNESILASAVATPSTGHEHTDSCYTGHRHKGGDNLYFTHTHAHDSSCKNFICTRNIRVRCSSCGSTYIACVAAYYMDEYGNTRTAWVDTTNASRCVYCNNTYMSSVGEINEYYYSCGYNRDLNGDGFSDYVEYYTPFQYFRDYPQDKHKATYTSGCYTYHQHSSWHDLISTKYAGWTYSNIEEFGFSNLCIVPAEIYLGMDTYYDGDSNEDWLANSCDTYMRYVTTYTKENGLLFVYGGFRRFRHWPHDWTNPGFPETLTEAQLKNFYPPYEYYKVFGYYYNSEFNVVSGDLVTCDYDAANSNKWILTCGQVENSTMICNKKVVSIEPTNPVQAVYTDEPLITTVRAAYQDGSTQVVLATTDFSTSSVTAEQIVTITYTDETGGKTTATIRVTVVPRSKTCPHGHVYNLENNGTDPGCPFCDKWVESIRVLNPTTSSMTINIGTTLQQNGVTILVRYYDGDTETITNGYVDNLDNTYLGTKLVTIGYKGATTSLMVTTVCLKMTCDICGYIYDLNPDGTNPGCPMCISKTPVFTGNILYYENADYTKAILEELYEDNIYCLGLGDVFTVGVENRSSMLARNLLKKIYWSLPDKWMFIERSIRIKEN